MGRMKGVGQARMPNTGGCGRVLARSRSEQRLGRKGGRGEGVLMKVDCGKAGGSQYCV